MIELAGKRVVLAEGETGPKGVKLLQADSQAAILLIEGKRRRLAVDRRVGGNYAAPSPRRVRISPNSRGSYQAAGSINGRELNFLVDTGAELVTLDQRLARHLGIEYQRDGLRMRVRTASGVATAWRVKLRRVSIGEIIQRDVPAAVIAGDTLSQPLLGMSFLGHTSLRHEGRVLVIERQY